MRDARNLALTLILIGLAGPAAGCRPSPTGLHVSVTFTGVSTQQLEFTVLAEDGVTPVVAPTRRPEAPQGDLASPQDLFVYLPDVAQTVVCRAATVSTPSAVGQQSVAVSPRAIAEVQLALGTTDRENGQPCTEAAQCASAFCVDGVCCGTSCDGTCVACNIPGSMGACAVVPAGLASGRNDCPADPVTTCGRDGKCDGAGHCRSYPIGVECAPTACTPSGDAVMSASRCDGMGACVAATTSTPCDPYLCDAASGRCFTSCTSGVECAPAHTCNASRCGLKPNGDGCADSTECNSGHCADRVCCNIDCAGACTACNLPGAPGICTVLPAGALDQHGVCTNQGSQSCAENGLCDGMGACQKYSTGTVCAPVDCMDTTLSSARACDGAGVCLPAATSVCPGNLRCNPGTKACYASCATDAECVGDFTCRNGRCR